MKYYNLGSGSKPCGILKWRGLTMMLDCSLDLGPVLNYLPLPLAGNSKFHNVPHFQNYQDSIEEELCELNNYVFVDSSPLFGVPIECSVNISEIDVILISNSSSILALPYYTNHPDFNGIVYATEPTVCIGKFFMDELVEFVSSNPKPKQKLGGGSSQSLGLEQSSNSESGAAIHFNGTGKETPNIFKLLDTTLKFPINLTNSCFKKDLREIYTKKNIGEALLKVKIVGFNEHLDIFGKLIATPVSSGFSLGSCNWIFKAEKKKVCYVTCSSTLTTHPSQMEQLALKDSDIFILSGLNKVPTFVPDTMLGEICVTTLTTLTAGGNVIFPIYPSGIIYDLFECLAGHLSANGCGTQPFYFIAPQSESSLAYSNILAEWLSANKQKKVYIPEDPFPHAELVKSNRLKHFKTLHDISEVRQPCVIFCGHPSVRFGDIVHLVESWGNNPLNTIIFTDTESPHLECLIPFQPLAIKTAYCPIDTSLNFHQANKLIRDLKPRVLLTHEEYCVPPKNCPNRPDLVLDYPNIEKMSPGSCVSLKLKTKYVSGLMDFKMASEIDPVVVSGGKEKLHASTITTCLDNSNNKYRLIQPEVSSLNHLKTPPTKYTWGSLDSNVIFEKLTAEGFNPTIQTTTNGFVISLPVERSIIQVEGTSTHIICDSTDGGSMRSKLRRVITSCLKQF